MTCQLKINHTLSTIPSRNINNIMVLFLGIYIRDYWTDKPRNNNLFVLTPMLALYSTAT